MPSRSSTAKRRQLSRPFRVAAARVPCDCVVRLGATSLAGMPEGARLLQGHLFLRHGETSPLLSDSMCWERPPPPISWSCDSPPLEVLRRLAAHRVPLSAIKRCRLSKLHLEVEPPTVSRPEIPPASLSAPLLHTRTPRKSFDTALPRSCVEQYYGARAAASDDR